jgi:hypothetical protein
LAGHQKGARQNAASKLLILNLFTRKYDVLLLLSLRSPCQVL